MKTLDPPASELVAMKGSEPNSVYIDECLDLLGPDAGPNLADCYIFSCDRQPRLACPVT